MVLQVSGTTNLLKFRQILNNSKPFAKKTSPLVDSSPQGIDSAVTSMIGSWRQAVAQAILEWGNHRQPY